LTLWVAFVLMSAGGLRAEHRVDYEDLKGARYNNTELGTCDVGWGGDDIHGDLAKIFPKGIEGIHFIDYCKDGADREKESRFPAREFAGTKELTLSAFGVKGKGIPLPRLGVSVDIRIADGAAGDYRDRIFADNGTVVKQGWRHTWGNRRIPAAAFVNRGWLLNSCELDSDSDGYWSRRVLREINTYEVPAELGYTLIVPATWFEVPPPSRSGRGVEPYRTLRFDYLGSEGRNKANIALREDYINPDGSLKIGFVYDCSKWEKQGRYIAGGRSLYKVYVIQSCNKGGIIIARLDRLKDERCLQIVKGTLRVSEQGESIRPRFGKKVSSYQFVYFSTYPRNNVEFRIYGFGNLFNSVCARTDRSLSYPPKFLWDDPYVKRRMKEHMKRFNYMLDTYRKYGVEDVYFEASALNMADFVVLYPQFTAKCYDKNTGAFSAFRYPGDEFGDGPRADAYSPAAQEVIEKYWVEYLKHLKGVSYIETSEMAAKGRLQKDTFRIGEEVYRYGGPFYSFATLEAYREYIGDTKARFPVPPGARETERTFCTADKKVWDRYREWIIDTYTDGRVLVMIRACMKAFKNNPSYKGYSYVQAARSLYSQSDLLDMKKIIAHPGLASFMNENGWEYESVRDMSRRYDALTKKHDKRQLMLFNAFSMAGFEGGTGFGPGNIPRSWRDGNPELRSIRPEEGLWIVDNILALLPDLNGVCWHNPGSDPDLYRFWRAYQTVEWDRDLMPMSEARKIMAGTTEALNKGRNDFDYDEDHPFRKVKIKRENKEFDIFADGTWDMAAVPLHSITPSEGIFRGTLAGNEQTQASFRVIAAGQDQICLFIEVADETYTGDFRNDLFPMGKSWAWKDKVDIYLGFSGQTGVALRGRGAIGRGPLPGKERYIQQMGAIGNTIWVEARCGEAQIACYYKRQRNPKDLSYGKAAWTYSPKDKKWTGRIRIDLKAIDKKLSAERLTGFNLGVQDVDDPCDFKGRVPSGGKAPFYMLYETYPRLIHATARYANVAFVGNTLQGRPEVRDFRDEDVFFVDLKPYCNMGFADETANDGKGGWDDTGPDNDLRMLPAGKQKMRGVPFHVIDAAGNRGRSCIVLRGKGNATFPLSAEGIAVEKKAASLFFLHTASGSGGNEDRCGRYVVHYADGSREDIDLELERNVGSWWYPGNLVEAEVAWKAAGGKAGSVGLYLMEWKNPHPEKKIGSLDIVSTGRGAVLHLVAVTGVQ